jgi:hypothetical protein
MRVYVCLFTWTTCRMSVIDSTRCYELWLTLSAPAYCITVISACSKFKNGGQAFQRYPLYLRINKIPSYLDLRLPYLNNFRTYDPAKLTPIRLRSKFFGLAVRNANFWLTPFCNALVAQIVTLNDPWQNIHLFLMFSIVEMFNVILL